MYLYMQIHIEADRYLPYLDIQTYIQTDSRQVGSLRRKSFRCGLIGLDAGLVTRN